VLELEAMNQSAEYLLGEHDFSAFLEQCTYDIAHHMVQEGIGFNIQ
jgi:tRNA U38,U39,U40 pseudouridine synthase TruA